LSVAEILDYFSAYKHPKLLIFGLCHIAGSEWSGHDKLLNPDHYSQDDNFLVAYSILPYGDLHSSSVWIELLSEAIQKEDNDVAFILDDVNSKLKELYSSLTSFVTPQSNNMLEKPVKLLSEASIGN